MGLLDNLKRYVRGEDFEDDDDMMEEEYAEEASSVRRRSHVREQAPVQETASTVTPGDFTRNKVVNIHTMTQLSVVLVKPDRYENAAEIADHLKDKRTVVLNLEQTNREIARRLLDFLSGVAYANEGKIKKVANSTYIITPYNVDIQGDLIDELESNGLYL